MPTGIVNNALSNDIEWATHNGAGLITGKRKDVTDSVIRAMFSHMMTNCRRDEKAKERGYVGYKMEGVGELRFIPETADEQQEVQNDEN